MSATPETVTATEDGTADETFPRGRDRRAGAGAKPRWPQALKSGARLAGSAALLYLLLRDTPVTEVLAAVRSADLALVALGFGLNLLGLGIITLRWRILLGSQEAPIPFVKLFESLLVARFFNNFLPSTVGGDASRMYDSWRLGVGGKTAVAVVVLDRGLGALALLLTATVGAWFLQAEASQLASTFDWLLGATLLAGVATLLLFGPVRAPGFLRSWLNRIPGRLGQTLVTGLLSLRPQRRELTLGFLLSLALQINVVVFYFVVAQSLDIALPFLPYLVIVPFAVAVMMIPISINAIGLREGAFVFLLGLYGVDPSRGIALAWIVYGLLLLQGLIGGAAYAIRK